MALSTPKQEKTKKKEVAEMYICQICKEEFTRRDHLRRHLRTVHKLTGDKLEAAMPKSKPKGRTPKPKALEKEFDREEALEGLSSLGFVVTRPQRVTDIHKKLNLSLFDGKTYKIGLVADNHFGSQYQQITHLHAFYKLCEREGITTILHAGDITDGQRVYRGQEFELFLHGADAQIDYTVKNYPHIKGIKTLFIGGNHDENHWSLAGIDVCRQIADRREDMEYLGMHGAYVHIDGISIYIHHPSGGVAYARSYKMQKMIEQFAPEQKPHILIQGHLHVQSFLPSYRNVVGIMMPCFQAQTPYLKRKGLNPEIGGVILEFQVDETINPHGIARVRPEFVMFRRQIPNDF